MEKKGIGSFFVIIGLVCLIFTIIFIAKDTGVVVDTNRYGADYYTDSQNAIAETANNIQIFTRLFKTFAIGVFTVAGLTFFGVGIYFCNSVDAPKTYVPKTTSIIPNKAPIIRQSKQTQVSGVARTVPAYCDECGGNVINNKCSCCDKRF